MGLVIVDIEDNTGFQTERAMGTDLIARPFVYCFYWKQHDELHPDSLLIIVQYPCGLALFYAEVLGLAPVYSDLHF